MIDFSKITEVELTELKQIVRTSVEKSALENYYLFTISTIEKSKIFIWCYRFLLNVCNIIEEGSLKNEIEKELKLLEKIYDEIIYLHEEYHKLNFGRDEIKKKLFNLVNSEESVGLIDTFSILTEKVNLIEIGKLKGIILEGKSGEEFKKVFKEL